MRDHSSVFDQARRASDVGQLLSVPAGSAWRRLKRCPFCEGRDDFSYRADAFRCWKCGEHGGVVELAAKLWSVSHFEAACRLAGADPHEERKTRVPASARPRRQPPRRDVEPTVASVIADIRRSMRRATNSLVERYLISRGLPGSFERHVHFCADAPYDVSALWGRGRRLPAMVCVIEVDGCATGGLHLTYLRADGRGKANTLGPKEPRKKMWGPQTDARGRPGGALLIAPRAETDVLCVAEGVENALTLAAIVGAGCGAFAAGSLDRFQGGMALNAWGGVDWRTPSPDPGRPAATIRHKGPVLLALDSDMSSITINQGTRWERVISPARRAQVSGVLATHWWMRAGASDVRCVTPPAGRDVNDLMKESA